MVNAERPAVFDQLHRPNYSGIPKYRLVLNAIAEGIESGHWKPGERLPTEDDLVQMTSYSLGTVQRALRILVDQGLVVREHGLGTSSRSSCCASRIPGIAASWPMTASVSCRSTPPSSAATTPAARANGSVISIPRPARR